MAGKRPVAGEAAAAATAAEPTFAQCVIDWQRHSGRHDLPWQRTRDPYRVWLSEIMLQQTQVTTVRVYFGRFLERFPDVAALAAAPEDDVFALWSGLGYYRRARYLHACARQVVAQHGGVFPTTAAALQTLPGIGRSTAAAIAAFCFGERVAILDGNVRRVLARVLAFDGDLSRAAQQDALWQQATELLPQHELTQAMPSYTQGLMDLGATVCRVRRPACAACPLAPVCNGFASGEPERYPVKTAVRGQRPRLDYWLLLARDHQGSVWLERRPAFGIWPGLFCVPMFESLAALEQAAAWVPHAARSARTLPALRHALTHRELLLHPVLLAPGSAAARSDQVVSSVRETPPGDWIGPSQWRQLGLPAPIRKLLDSLQ